jgi:hypothetical protein
VTEGARVVLAWLLWLILLAAASVTLHGCDWDSPGWEIEWNGTQPHPSILQAILLIEDEYPCPTPERLRGRGRIVWHAEPFPCGQGNPLVQGCFDPVGGGSPWFEVQNFPRLVDTALAHELGHWGWLLCGRESYLGDGSHPPAFIEWTNRVRERLLAAGVKD